MTRRQATFAAGRSRPARLRRATTPWRAAVLVVAGLLLASLLTAPALLATAQRQPYGPTRTALVGAAERLAAVSSATRLDVPWHTLDGWVHRPATPAVQPRPSEAPTPPVIAAPAPSPQTTAPATPPAPEASMTPSPSRPAADPTPPDAPVVAAPTPGVPATTVSGRVPTADDPLRVWIAGDSMWERPGPKLVEALASTGVVDVLDLEVRYSTGLTRPDFFDWPAHAAARLAALDPEVVLFQVGPNDSQPLVEGGVAHPPLSDGFNRAYAARVRTLMELLAGDGRQVLWIGLPPMRSDGFDQRMGDLDGAYATVAATIDGVQHISTRALFSDAAGDYAEYLPGPDGTPRPMRNRDGIHLSEDGARRLAALLFDQLDTRHHLTD